jgi:hypothetical protein
MNNRIQIIGAGWYGCYIGLLCKSRGIEYVIYEKDDQIFNGASFYNQNRLHQGFHYPRDYETRHDSHKGFYKFLNVFKELTTSIENNIYAVHNNSILDFQTYVNIFSFEGYEFEILKNTFSKNFQGVIRVNERFVDPYKSKKYFEDCGLNIEFNSKIEIVEDEYYLNGQLLKADLIVNATYGQLISKSSSQYYFNQDFLTILIKRVSQNCPFDSLTVMDGEFYSIYPYKIDDRIYTLTHVKFGVLNGFPTECEVKTIFNNIRNEIIMDIPDFEKDFEFFGSFTSRKYKPKSSSDLRTVKFFRDKNRVVICSGKIDTIFLADELLGKN